MAAEKPGSAGPEHEVLIVGAGFGGLGLAIRLQQSGIRNFLVLEKGDDVGGTWRENTYPGCACDVPSHLYSFSFEPKKDWSRTYAPQSEILAYLRGLADKHGLRDRIRLRTAMVEARYDEARACWQVTTDGGETLSARVLVPAMGALSRPSIPDLPGLADFQGPVFHSAQWRHDLDLRGQRVAVVGTGASAIQIVPQMQRIAAEVHLVQRTPAWVLPKDDRPYTRRERWLIAHLPGWRRLLRQWIYWRQEIQVLGFTSHPGLMRRAQGWGLAHMKRAVKDPALREQLTPRYTLGCKRVLLSNEYFPALAQPNARVHDARTLTRVTPQGLDFGGRQVAVDAIILGTGFRPTDLFSPLRLIGRGGVDLNDHWAQHGIQAWRGAMVAGWPNLFMLVGPNTGLGHSSMVFMIETQVEFLLRLLARMKARGATTLEVTPQAEADWNQEVQARTASSVWKSGCQSWYFDKTGRNVTLWPGFTFQFWWRLLRTRWSDLRLARG